MSAHRLFQPHLAGACLGLLLAVWSAGARAEETDSPAVNLFKQGRALVGEGKYAEACPKFEASLALEVGVGTQFHLADCWEHIGRTASARKLFLGAAASAKAAGQADREQVLRDRAAALEPRIAKLVVDVAATSPHLSIKLDQLPLDEAEWGKAVPIDAGSYTVTAKAPGKKPWSTQVAVKPGATVVSVEVPELEPLAEPKEAASKPSPAAKPPSAPTAPAPSESDRRSSRPSYAALALGGVGIAALSFGTVLGLRYRSHNDEAKGICPSNLNCTQKDIEDHDSLVDDARTERSWMYVGLASGTLSLAGAAVLYLLDKPKSEHALRAVPLVSANAAGAGLIGRF